MNFPARSLELYRRLLRRKPFFPFLTTFGVTIFGLLGCVANPAKLSLAVANSPKMTERYYLAGCAILDDHFQLIRQLPGGNLCQVFADGSWISSNSSQLQSWSANGEVNWTLHGNYHHQIREDRDGNLLLLTSELISFRKHKIRLDVIEKRDRAGKLLAAWRARDHLFDFERFRSSPARKRLGWAGVHLAAAPTARFEVTHINSIQVLPEGLQLLPKEAAYLINDPIFNVALGLDRELRTINWGLQLPDFETKSSPKHDVQILEDGALLYFDNEAYMPVTDGSGGNKKASFAVLMQDLSGQVLFRFPTNSKDYLATQAKGSVERSGQTFLVNVAADGHSHVGWVDMSGQWLNKVILDQELQEIKLISFGSEFLRHNQAR